jgi:hypothetical protein
MQTRVFAVILAACAVLASAACSQQPAHEAARNQPQASHESHQPAASPAQSAEASPTVSAAARRIPAHFVSPPPLESLAPTLSPESFQDPKVRAAYQAAKQIPQTIAQLPCFCYCDEGYGHKSLHSCYENDHSVGCGTCQDEALMALQLKGEGLTDAQIRDRIIMTFQ